MMSLLFLAINLMGGSMFAMHITSNSFSFQFTCVRVPIYSLSWKYKCSAAQQELLNAFALRAKKCVTYDPLAAALYPIHPRARIYRDYLNIIFWLKRPPLLNKRMNIKVNQTTIIQQIFEFYIPSECRASISVNKCLS